MNLCFRLAREPRPPVGQANRGPGTFHTPYYTEDSWTVSVPGVFEFSISAALGFAVLTLLLLLGTLLLCLATVAFWRDRLTVAVDETESNQN